MQTVQPSVGMGLVARLCVLLNLQPAERLPVALLLAHSFFKGVSSIFVGTAVNTLFLSVLNAQAMPYVYIASAIVATTLGVAFARVETRLSPMRLLAGTLVFLIAGTAAVGVALMLDRSPVTIMAAMIWKVIAWILGGLEFWALAGLLLDLRQSKRLFPLVGAGEVCAMIVGGLTVPFFVEIMGTPGLLFVACFGFLASLFLFSRAIKLVPAGRDSARETKNAHQGVRPLQIHTILHNRYLTLFFMLTVLSNFAYFLIDYLFYETVQRAFQDEAQLARFFGLFQAIVGAAQFVVGVFLAAPLIQRFGIGLGLCVLPGACLITALCVLFASYDARLVTAMFWTVAATKMFDVVLRVGTEMPAFRILYQPLPQNQKLRVQTLRETILEPLAMGFSGAFLLIVNTYFQASTITFASLIIAVLITALFLNLRMTREYLKALLDSLAQREIPDIGNAFQDSSTQAILLTRLSSNNAEEAIFCATSLEKSEYVEMDEVFHRLLERPEVTVRAHALSRIELRAAAQAGCHVTLVPTLLRMISFDESPVLKADALRACMACLGPSSNETAKPFLASTDPFLRKSAFVSVLRYGGIEGAFNAAPEFEKLLASPAAEDRIMAAIILGEVAATGLYNLLITLLEDREMRVRRAALHSAGAIAHPQLTAHIVRALEEAETKTAAKAALLKFDAQSLPFLEKALVQKPLHHPLRRELTLCIGAIRGSAATQTLASLLNAPDACVRQAALEAFAERPDGSNGPSLSNIPTLIALEMEDAAFLFRAAQAFEAFAQFHDALGNEFLASRGRVLLLLGILVPGKPMRNARSAILAGSSAQRANAIEAIERMLPIQGRAGIIRFLEEPHLPMLQQRASGQVAVDAPDLRAVIRHRCTTPWLQALALFVIPRDLDVDDVVGSDLAGSASLIVREVLQWRSQIPSKRGRSHMLLIEKVLFLRKADLFRGIPDDALIGVAAVLEEVEIFASERIFDKGDAGTSMYVLVEGRVRIHDGQSELATLSAPDVFGEMSAIDTELRSASITALDDCRLLRLDQEALYHLMSQRVEIARSIISLLCAKLRAR